MIPDDGMGDLCNCWSCRTRREQSIKVSTPESRGENRAEVDADIRERCREEIAASGDC